MLRDALNRIAYSDERPAREGWAGISRHGRLLALDRYCGACTVSRTFTGRMPSITSP